MNRRKMKNSVNQRKIFLSGLLVLSGLFTGCSENNQVVNEIEEEEVIEKPYSVAIRDGNSNMPPGGGTITAQYTDFISGCDLGKMTDSKPETKYEVPYKAFHVIWSCTNKTFVNHYSLTSAQDSPNSDPKSWVLYGSNDKKNWNSLDKQSDQKFTKRGESKEYAIANEEEYKYYKLEINTNHGAPTTHIAEWGMQAYSVIVDNGIANMPPGGGVITPQYSFYTSGFDVGLMVDSKPETKYVTPYKSFYVLWTSHQATLINYYSLTSANDSPESDPKSWVLYGSNNKKTWVSLDEQTNQEFTTRGEEKQYTIENDTKYIFYKLDIKSNQGASSTQIAEWAMKDISIIINDGVSDMPSGDGIIKPQYADFVFGNDVSKMVDSNPDTKYVTPYKYFYVLWTNSKSTLINQYSLTAADNSPDSDPRSWTLIASNDKKTWTQLDEQNDQQFNVRGEVKEYSIANKREFKYYKLVIKDNWGASSTQIAEWSMQRLYTDTGIKIISCMEVNNTNPLNNLSFTLKGSKKPLIDIVILFSANINYNNETGKVYVHNNPNVQHILSNKEKYLKPLQDRGIKVVLGILGNHDRSGVANLADETARAFAQELKTVCDLYNLDGIFFDDEYSSYQNPPPAGFVSPSSAAASRLCYETKMAMPDKIVSVYVYNYTRSLPSVDGVQSGEFVDYGIHDYGGSSDLSSNYPGMPKSGMALYSQEFILGYYTSANNLKRLRDDGYGAHMIFSMDPTRFDYQNSQLPALRMLATELCDDELVVGNFYRKDW